MYRGSSQQLWEGKLGDAVEPCGGELILSIANLVILEGRFYYLHFIDVKNVLEKNGAVFVDNIYIYIYTYI